MEVTHDSKLAPHQMLWVILHALTISTILGTISFHLNSSHCNTKVVLHYLVGIKPFLLGTMTLLESFGTAMFVVKHADFIM